MSDKNLLNKGYTLLEMLLVMAILGVLASVLVVAINPARQLAKARDTQRETHLLAILGAVYQYTTEHSGALPDTTSESFPTASTCIGTDLGCFDLASAGEVDSKIVPVYLAEIPMDPRTGTTGNTGYTIYVDPNRRLIASASGETKTITFTR